MASLLNSLVTILDPTSTDQATSATKTGGNKQTTAIDTETKTNTRAVSRSETSQANPTSTAPQTNALYIGDSSQTHSTNSTAFVTVSSTSSSSASAPARITLTDTSTAQPKTTLTSISVSSIDLTSAVPTMTTTSSDTSTSSSSTITSPPPTTLVTSTSASASSPSITPTATTSSAAQPTSAADSSSASSGKVPTVGIAVAAVLGFLVLATILFLVFRYCAPIRRKYDEWQENKRLARTYREAIDGAPSPPDKISRSRSPQFEMYNSNRFYEHDNVDHRYNTPGNGGLGLGNRLSMLMQHAPFQSSHQGLDRSQIGIAMTDPRARGQYAPAR